MRVNHTLGRSPVFMTAISCQVMEEKASKQSSTLNVLEKGFLEATLRFGSICSMVPSSMLLEVVGLEY